jgi:anaphase-promoting complex subunit 10
MPHLRRQPNAREFISNQDLNAPDLRAQFQTPPTRHTPTNLTHQHHPSTGPNAFTPDPVAQAGHPAASINPFMIFGRPRAEQVQQVQQAPPMMDSDDFDDDYDPRGHAMQELEEDGGYLNHDDSFGDDQAEEGQFDDDSDLEDEELEEVAEDQFEEEEEDVDEEMHDQGTDSYLRSPLFSHDYAFSNVQSNTLYRKITISVTTQLARNLLTRFLDRLNL